MSERFSALSFEPTPSMVEIKVPPFREIYRPEPPAYETQRQRARILAEELMRSDLSKKVLVLALIAATNVYAGWTLNELREKSRLQTAAAEDPYPEQPRDPQQHREWQTVHNETGRGFYTEAFQENDQIPDRAARLQREREQTPRTTVTGFEGVRVSNEAVQEYLINTFPPSWTSRDNVSEIHLTYQRRVITDYGEGLHGAHAAADCSTSLGAEASQITFYPDSFFAINTSDSFDPKTPDLTLTVQAFETYVGHEFTHSRDFFSSSYLTREQRIHTLYRVLGRLNSGHAFHSGYVAGITNTIPTTRQWNRATEYIAVIGENIWAFDEATYRQTHQVPFAQPTRLVLRDYLAERGQISQTDAEEDLSLYEQLIHYTDPTYDLAQTMPQRHEARAKFLETLLQNNRISDRAQLEKEIAPETRRLFETLQDAVQNSLLGALTTAAHDPTLTNAQRWDMRELRERLEVQTFRQVEPILLPEDRLFVLDLFQSLVPKGVFVRPHALGPRMQKLDDQFQIEVAQGSLLRLLQEHLQRNPSFSPQLQQLIHAVRTMHLPSAERALLPPRYRDIDTPLRKPVS